MPPTGSSPRPRLLSGMQPTAASLHLGDHLGALTQWVALQESHDAFYVVADLHVSPPPQAAKEVRERTRATVAQILAAGVDPNRSALFLQSHVREHAELSWVLQCVTEFGEASRIGDFEAGSAGEGAEGVPVALFTDPILQSADILVYNAEQVLIGADERQHLELTRDLAQRFNSRFGATFVVPEPYSAEAAPTIRDLQRPDEAMGSAGGSGCLWLLDDPKVSAKKIRSAVTDTGREVTYDLVEKPGVSNLLTILSAISGDDVPTLEKQFEGAGYGDLKQAVAQAYAGFAEPFAERVRELLASPGELDDVLAAGADAARAAAAPVLAQVHERVGFLPATSEPATSGRP